MEGNLPFLLCFTLCFRAISKYNSPPPPPGWAYIWRGDLRERLLSYEFGGLIFGGASTWRGLFLEFYGIISEIRVSQPLANRSVAHKL